MYIFPYKTNLSGSAKKCGCFSKISLRDLGTEEKILWEAVFSDILFMKHIKNRNLFMRIKNHSFRFEELINHSSDLLETNFTFSFVHTVVG